MAFNALIDGIDGRDFAPRPKVNEGDEGVCEVALSRNMESSMS